MLEDRHVDVVTARHVAGGVWVSKLIWFKPFNIDHFFNRVFIQYALDDPELLTQMRILEPSDGGLAQANRHGDGIRF